MSPAPGGLPVSWHRQALNTRSDQEEHDAGCAASLRRVQRAGDLAGLRVPAVSTSGLACASSVRGSLWGGEDGENPFYCAGI